MNKCVGRCSYFAECLEARVRTDDPREAQFLEDLLEAGQSCLNTPPSRYNPEDYRECATLLAGQLSVGLSVANGEALTTAERFFAGFFDISQQEQ